MRTRVFDDVSVNELGVRRRGQRRRVVSESDLPSMTKQADLPNANIHSLLSRFSNTGLLPQKVAKPIDKHSFVEGASFHESMSLVTAAQQQFMQQPVAIRQRFDNSPEKFFEFCTDAKNIDELRNLGLANPVVSEVIQKVQVVNSPASEPSNSSREAGE